MGDVEDVQDDWYERFAREILANLPTLTLTNQFGCRTCFRVYLVPCHARDCETDHFDDGDPEILRGPSGST